MTTPVNSIEANVLLCDAADIVGGKMYILGGGWSVLTLTEAHRLVLATTLAIPWELTNRKLKLDISLFDEDGEIVENDGEPMAAKGDLEIGRPVESRPGSFQSVPFVTPFKAIDLEAGGYVFVLAVDDQPLARARFQVKRG